MDTCTHEGKEVIGIITSRELLLIGCALYWGEGSKQSKRSPSTGLIFTNTDYRMILVYLEWLRILEVPGTSLRFELYIHENRKTEVEDFVQWWATILAIHSAAISVYYKNGNPVTNRSNSDNLYRGIIRIKVRESTALNRKVAGLIEGVVASVGSGVTGNTSAFEAEDSRIVP